MCVIQVIRGYFWRILVGFYGTPRVDRGSWNRGFGTTREANLFSLHMLSSSLSSLRY